MAFGDFVQDDYGANSASDTSIAVAFGSNNAAGAFLVLAVSFNGITTTVSSVTDTRGNTWVEDDLQRSTEGGSQNLAVWHCASGASGANTVTVNFSAASTFRSLIIAEYGGGTGVIFDIGASTGGNSTSPSSGSATPTVNGCLLIGAVHDESGSTTITASGAYTIRSTGAGEIAIEDQVQGTAASIAATFSFTDAHAWMCILAAYKQTSGATRPMFRGQA
jgi:hypothetical protein